MLFHDSEQFTLYNGDSKKILATLLENSIDSIVTDPPYELGFMGKSWDSTGIANDIDLWKEVLRVLKPGGHLLAFSGSRTYHRMVVAIEDAGFEIRDQIMWVYGSGFPKSHNISKGIDKAAGATPIETGLPNNLNSCLGGSACHCETDGTKFSATKHAAKTIAATPAAKQWDGWGTALKPAHEPIVLARKPFTGTVANNVLSYGVGGINIDATRVGTEIVSTHHAPKGTFAGGEPDRGSDTSTYENHTGRWPANFIHDGSDEVNDLLGEPARFFYCAKAGKRDRNEGLDSFNDKEIHRFGSGIGEGKTPDAPSIEKNNHPTVKPTDLMRYLCRLITPPNGTILDPFLGSGSTGKAAMYEGFKFIGIELTQEYLPIAKARIEFALNNQDEKLF